MRAAASSSSLTAVLVRPASLTALLGDGVRLRHLAVDLVDRGGQFVGGRGDVAHIGGGFGGRRRRALGLGRGVVGGAGELGRGGEHLVGDAAELGQGCLDLGGKARDFGRHLLLPAAARIGVFDHGAIELDVARHGVLEHADRARQRADLVAAVAERNGDGALAAGDLLGHARDALERHGDAARDHVTAGKRHQNGKAGEQRHQQRGAVDGTADLA